MELGHAGADDGWDDRHEPPKEDTLGGYGKKERWYKGSQVADMRESFTYDDCDERADGPYSC